MLCVIERFVLTIFLNIFFDNKGDSLFIGYLKIVHDIFDTVLIIFIVSLWCPKKNWVNDDGKRI